MTAKQELQLILSDKSIDAVDISPERLGELFAAATEIPEQLTGLVGSTVRRVVDRADMEALLNVVA